ncbi:DEAD/DEAH box helicase family protein [Niabella drilacis]|uniref:Type III restriction enzyme, res subunit n=1 Tax=Niabella drilacis (strain DSM 25811 / CCM 8410 / CCUG 62505 / LMG 26954 / E90) TaxID=1285928 RepID=A0A1G7AGB4_NIADE|nr:DEAD/DEAH box helicase family protein [Niabella drilacis]SDE13861.1 Type III restriction enzyme, res subunit [Niabella drilacis]
MSIKTTPVKKATLPIEYKMLSAEDFEKDYLVKDNKTTYIEPNPSGYISDTLIGEVDLYERNTVAINCGVGQGKSTTCINLAKQYYAKVDENGEREFTIVFATPYISILNQYHRLLVESDSGISDSDIYLYTSIDETSDFRKIAKTPIHLITINSLLGNYGEEAFLQAKLKRSYLDNIIFHCERKKKKVIFFFDEIHEGVRSFKQRFIWNLWKWQEVISKIFVLSATFSESAKIILKYLADLTDDRIQLVESRRVRISQKLVPLNICLINGSYHANNEEIANIIQQEVDKGKRIHILSYSENLASEMVLGIKNNNTYDPTSVSKILKNNPSHEELRLCTGETGVSFDEQFWNIGTNFKTGINITRANTSFIIILPHMRSYDSKNRDSMGIFTEGSNTIIQAIARMRTAINNEILLIMPPPKRLIQNERLSGGLSDYLKRVSVVPVLRQLKLFKESAKYHNINSQLKLLERFDAQRRSVISKGFSNFNFRSMYIKKRSETKPKLDYPDLQEFVMEDGDRYLYSSFEIFGSNLSAYAIWAAFNNQFENATLQNVLYKDKVILKEGGIVQKILEIFNSQLSGDSHSGFTSEKKLFEILYAYFTEAIATEVKKNGKKHYITAAKSPEFKKALITVVKLIKRPTERFRSQVYPSGGTQNAIDYFIDRNTYILAALNSVQNDLLLVGENHVIDHHLSDNDQLFLNQYRKLYLFAELYKKNAVFTSTNGKRYILKKNDILEKELFSVEQQLYFLDILKYLRENDFFFRDDTFSFFQWTSGLDIPTLRTSEVDLKKYFGKAIDTLRDILFTTKPTTLSERTLLTNTNNIEITNLKSKPYEITKEHDYINISALNLVYNSSIPFIESTAYNHFEFPENPNDCETIGTL